MSQAHTSAALRGIGVLYRSGVAGGGSDGELLGRAADRRDPASTEAAFRTLVERHGPMVWGVCRRSLGVQDAEDAFQATFLVLARRAGSVRVDDSLGPWLYGVARKVVARARRVAERRSSREVASPFEPSAPDGREAEARDLRRLIDDELSRLPSSWRATIVLCDLEGLTHEEAARSLRCPTGTVKSRLARARDRLRARLTRRGVVPSTLAVAVPTALAESTVRAATAGAVPASAYLLARGVLTMLLLTKVKTAVGVLGVVSLIAAATASAYQPAPDDAPPATKTPRAKAADEPASPEPTDAPETDATPAPRPKARRQHSQFTRKPVASPARSPAKADVVGRNHIDPDDETSDRQESPSRRGPSPARSKTPPADGVKAQTQSLKDELNSDLDEAMKEELELIELASEAEVSYQNATIQVDLLAASIEALLKEYRDLSPEDYLKLKSKEPEGAGPASEEFKKMDLMLKGLTKDYAAKKAEKRRWEYMMIAIAEQFAGSKDMGKILGPDYPRKFGAGDKK